MNAEQSKRTCVLYLRVSTGNQTTDNQRPDLVRLAKERGLEVVEVYEETASATKGARPAFQRMMADAHSLKFSAVLVWSIDRLGRSMVGNLGAVLALDQLLIQVISCREPWLDTGSPVRPLLVAIFSWVAEQEARRVSERTKASLAVVRAAGKTKLGRPRAKVDIEKALQLINGDGLTIRAVASRLHVSHSTLHRVLVTHRALAGARVSETSAAKEPVPEAPQVPAATKAA